MHGRIQKILSLENFFLVFHTGQCEPSLPFEAIGPKGSYFFSGLSITVFIRKHITTCDFPGGSVNSLSSTLGTGTCDD